MSITCRKNSDYSLKISLKSALFEFENKINNETFLSCITWISMLLIIIPVVKSTLLHCILHIELSFKWSVDQRHSTLSETLTWRSRTLLYWLHKRLMTAASSSCLVSPSHANPASPAALDTISSLKPNNYTILTTPYMELPSFLTCSALSVFWSPWVALSK